MKYLKKIFYIVVVTFSIMGLLSTIKLFKKKVLRSSGFLNIFYSIPKYKKYEEIPKIEKIFVINLDSSEDRLKRINFILQDLNLGPKIVRSTASYGAGLMFSNVNNSLTFEFKDIKSKGLSFNEEMIVDCGSNVQVKFSKLNYISTYYKRFPGELGCFCSHRVLWKRILDEGLEKAMIIEDDITFQNGAKNFLEKALRDIPSNSDIIFTRTEAIFTNKLERNIPYNGFKKITYDFLGTDAYILTRKAAKILYENSEYMLQPVDEYISYSIKSGLLNGYVVDPYITHQNDAKSIISS